MLRDNPTSKWEGRRYIALARQSNDQDGDGSTDDQINWMCAQADKAGMRHVESIALVGVTGSLPGRCEDLKQIIQRKVEKDDFDVLVVQRLDRLTRGGADHGHWFHWECHSVGIEIMHPGDNLPEDSPFGATIRSMMFDAAKEQARSISQRSVQGAIRAVRDRQKSVVSRTPFGCDRVYLNSERKPLFAIRDLGDGRQQKLHLETGEVIDTYGQIGGGSKGHYRKQKSELVEMRPGDPDRVEAVRRMFDLHYNERWGGKRIADDLNRRGIRSPTGKGWSQRQVEAIYENPIYCGWALGRYRTQAIYNTQDDDGPKAVHLDARTLATCRWAPRQYRPPEDWVWEEHPRMHDFLPQPLRDKALAEIKKLLMERWGRRQGLRSTKRSTSKHKNSQYILTGLLYAKQDGEPISGILCGRVGQKERRYRHRRGNRQYQKGSLYNRTINAQLLEGAILDVLRDLLADAPMLRERVMTTLATEGPDDDAEERLTKLRAERAALQRRVELITQTLSEESLDDAQAELHRIDQRRRELQAEVAHLERQATPAEQSPDDVADAVIAKLGSLKDQLDSLSPAAMRELLQAFIERVEVDLETRDAEIVFRLPPREAEKGDLAMRLANSSRSSTVDETHQAVDEPDAAGPGVAGAGLDAGDAAEAGAQAAHKAAQHSAAEGGVDGQPVQMPNNTSSDFSSSCDDIHVDSGGSRNAKTPPRGVEPLFPG